MNAPAVLWFLAPVCGLLSALLAGLAWLVAWLERYRDDGGTPVER